MQHGEISFRHSASGSAGFGGAGLRAIPTPETNDIAGFSRERLARLPAALHLEVQKGRIPGAVVLVARDGQIVLHEAVGVRDKAATARGETAPMAADAIFRIYSMTKPIVSVAIMMLVEDGKILLSDPVSKHLPELRSTKVAVQTPGADGKPVLEYVPPAREMTVQDLLRHTSGLTYGQSAPAEVRHAMAMARLFDPNQTSAEFVAKLAALPLVFHPGTVWEYGFSTDVLGVLIERVSGQPLDEFIAARILKPLGMNDTGFHVPADKLARLAEALPADPDTGQPIRLIDVRTKPRFLSGGGGMVSTARDYFRFTQMLLNGGELDGVRILSRKTVEYMTADHLGPLARPGHRAYYPGAGYGFSLGFAVRVDAGLSPQPATVGDSYWAGYGGTYFWIDPKERLTAILMVMSPDKGLPCWMRTRWLVYSSLVR